MTLSVSRIYIASNVRLLILKDLEGSGRILIEVVPLHFLGEAEDNHESISLDSWCTGRDSNPASRLLQPYQPVL